VKKQETQTAPTAQDAKTAARRAYYREWAKKNPDKVKAKMDRFWARQAERMKGGGENDS
jgi:hypothetical protein